MATPTYQAPLTDKFKENVANVAAGSDLTTIVAKARFTGTVTSVTYAPVAGITGADTNTRLVQLVNKGQNGSGSTVIASLQFNSGVNATAFDEKPITLSGTPANLDVAADDILAWVSTHVGTGLADPGGTVFVEISRA